MIANFLLKKKRAKTTQRLHGAAGESLPLLTKPFHLKTVLYKPSQITMIMLYRVVTRLT